MKRTFTLLFVFLCTQYLVLNAQKTLDPNQFVNTQITGPGVYKLEAGKAYAFDGRIDLTYEITIEGPEVSWILNATNPPVLVNTPAANGSTRTFFEIKEGGALTLKNLVITGRHSNGEIGSGFVVNSGGSKLILDNVCAADWQDYAFHNKFQGAEWKATNCVFINGVRLRYSEWGGFPSRMDVATSLVVWENNTVVNSGRLLTNSGPFHNANIYEIHNTYVNQAVAGHEQRANEMITANNIFYNFHFVGYKTAKHTSPNNVYDSYFTTWNYFAESKNSLDKISLYLGQNLFYREPQIENWFNTVGGDSVDASLLWEHANVDSFITIDNNYTIGANYAEIEPGFKTHPGNTSKIVDYINNYRTGQTSSWVDWRIESPVTFNTEGFPVLNWPPKFDLSYTNAGLKTAGTDKLPLGDLNWFPDKKAEYIANREAFITAMKDSMVNAKFVYDPASMEKTPLITEIATSIGKIYTQPQLFEWSGNYPNPFGQSTSIQFKLSNHANVTLSVYDLTGQKVFGLTKDALTPGAHTFNVNGNNLSSGIYICTLDAISVNGQKFTKTWKMVKE